MIRRHLMVLAVIAALLPELAAAAPALPDISLGRIGEQTASQRLPRICFTRDSKSQAPSSSIFAMASPSKALSWLSTAAS